MKLTFLADSKFNMVAKEYVPKRLKVSEDLAKIIGTKKGQKVILLSQNCLIIFSQVTRAQAMKKLWAYIKEKGLKVIFHLFLPPFVISF